MAAHRLLRRLEALAGVAVVEVVTSDVFRSVVLPRATRRTLRIGPVIGAAVPPLAALTGRFGDPEARW